VGRRGICAISAFINYYIEGDNFVEMALVFVIINQIIECLQLMYLLPRDVVLG